MRHLISTLAITAVTACGTQGSAPQTFGFALPGTQPSEPLRDRLTPDLLVNIDGPAALFEMSGTGAEAVAIPVSVRKDRTIWQTQDGVHIIFEGGVLVATRGLGNDLMAADVTDVQDALTNLRPSQRFHQYLDGEDQIETRTFVCSYQRTRGITFDTVFTHHNGTRILETCTTSDFEVENTYWFDNRRILWKSEQWVGAFNGFLTTELIKQGEFTP